MSLWTSLSSWALAKEERRVERQKTYLRKGLTYAQFANTMSALEGNMSTLFDLSGSITLQRLGEMVSRYTSDLAGSMSNMLQEQSETVQRYVNQRCNMLTEVISGYFTAHNAAAELRHGEQASRQEETNAAIFGLYEYMKANEMNQSARYLAIQEHIRMEAAQQSEAQAVTFKTLICLFENLTDQIQSLKKRQIERPPGPTLPWLMDKAEDLIRLGYALNNMRENNAPPTMTTVEVVKSVRALLDHNVSIADIGDALNDKALAWGVAA